MAHIQDLLGKTLIRVENNKDEIIFFGDDGRKWKLYHDQDCCESVEVEDVVGNLSDLVGSPVLMAEGITDGTWTFYKFATLKGYVTIRWYGESNGYYSVRVDFAEAS